MKNNISPTPTKTIDFPGNMMKRTIFLLLILSTTFFGLRAQEFKGGVLAGFNGSQVEGDASSGYKKLGLTGGAWIQRDVSERVYWGMELKVNQKGSRKWVAQNSNWKYVFRINYIDLPVMAGFRIQPDWSVFGGLSFGYVFNMHSKSSYGDEPTDLYNIAPWELGMFAGIRVDFERLMRRNWAKRLQLETRFHYSALSIDENHDLFTKYFSNGQFNNVISTVLYYRMDWPGKQ